jgi:hypothetical protein
MNNIRILDRKIAAYWTVWLHIVEKQNIGLEDIAKILAIISSEYV